jgi:hypothetical protein
MLLTPTHKNVNLVNTHRILKRGKEDIEEVILHNPTNCALWWHKLDW